jgi:eukaryotic-like serine/threonine-protein kinase
VEWVTGWTIADLIQRQRAIPFGEVAMVGRHVLEALEAARRRGVIHGDIKPRNLMVIPEGRVKVMDFGIAKESALAAASGSTGLVGTPAYMAPEQLRGESLDCRTDLYALGITLYQMLAGRVPFEAPSTAGYMYQHLQMSPKPLAEVRPEVRPGLAAVVHRAMAKAPSNGSHSTSSNASSPRRSSTSACASSTGSTSGAPGRPSPRTRRRSAGPTPASRGSAGRWTGS